MRSDFSLKKSNSFPTQYTNIVPLLDFDQLWLLKQCNFCLKKSMNASKPSNRSKGLGGNIDCRDKSSYGIKKVSQCSHIVSTV